MHKYNRRELWRQIVEGGMEESIYAFNVSIMNKHYIQYEGR